MMFLILLIGLGRGFAMSFPIHMHSYDAMDCVLMDSEFPIRLHNGWASTGTSSSIELQQLLQAFTAQR